MLNVECAKSSKVKKQLATWLQQSVVSIMGMFTNLLSKVFGHSTPELSSTDASPTTTVESATAPSPTTPMASAVASSLPLPWLLLRPT